jgi:hypothetical protein
MLSLAAGAALHTLALHHDHAGRRPLASLHDALPTDFQEERFRRRVDKALESVRTLLDTARKPTYAEGVPHHYDDKYALAEFLTSVALAAQLNTLEKLGLGSAELSTLVTAVGRGATATLRLRTSERTQFVREATRDVSAGSVHKHSGLFGTSESAVVNRITEHFWRHEASYELVASIGGNATLTLLRRSGHAELVTRVRESPRPEVREPPPIDVDLSWLLRHISPDLKVRFAIERGAPTCRTPRRNRQVEAALRSAAALHQWATNVHNHFVELFKRAASSSGAASSPAASSGMRTRSLDLSAIAEHAARVFVPVLPLFEPAASEPAAHNASATARGAAGKPSPGKPSPAAPSNAAGASGGGAVSVGACSSPLLPRVSDVHILLAEQRRTLHAAAASLDVAFPSGGSTDGGGGGGELVSAAEARLCLLSRHLRDVLAQWSDGVQYIESMLTDQLVAAIGKRLSPTDFAAFMVHHESGLYAPAYAPRPFTFAVRRPGHAPEGVVAIEGGAAARTADEPIRTISRQLSSAVDLAPMSFALNAATRVSFSGERHVHAFLDHQFQVTDDSTPPPEHPLRLTAR